MRQGLSSNAQFTDLTACGNPHRSRPGMVLQDGHRQAPTTGSSHRDVGIDTCSNPGAEYDQLSGTTILTTVRVRYTGSVRGHVIERGDILTVVCGLDVWHLPARPRA